MSDVTFWLCAAMALSFVGGLFIGWALAPRNPKGDAYVGPYPLCLISGNKTRSHRRALVRSGSAVARRTS